MNQISDGFWSETAWQAVEPEHLACSVVTPLPPSLPFPCFPDVVAELLGTLLEEEWSSLSERARQYLKWLAIKAESIDALAPKSPQSPTKGFELLAMDRSGQSFGKIVKQCKELEIPSVLLRFSSLIATFLTIRLLRRQMKMDNQPMPALMFTQNVDADYLNYPRALKNLLKLFPEYQSMFYFEVNELITPDYLPTIRNLSQDLGIRLALDDSNKMNQDVHNGLIDLADWIKIDFQATRVLEDYLQQGLGDRLLEHYENYGRGNNSPVIVFEGLGETSPLKYFLEENWKNSKTAIYYQSRERLPLPPWDHYFGMIQDYLPEDYGLFFKGLLQE